MSEKLRDRSQIAEKYTWNPHSVFPNDDAWAAGLGQIKEMLPEIATWHGRLHEGADVVMACMEQVEALYKLAGKVYVYASMFYAVDTADQEAAARNDQAQGMFGQAMATIAFVEPELIAIGHDTLKEWLAGNEQMAHYAHYFETLFKRQKHVRSAEVEQVLGLVNDAFRTASATHGVLANTDLKFEPARPADGEPIEIGQGNIGALISSTDRKTRRTAYDHYTDAHLTFKNTMANNLSAGVKQDLFFMRTRSYDSCLEAALQPNHIPVEVFHNTIDTFQKNIGTWHRYWRVRRQALGYDTLYPYDIKAPLTKEKPNVSYEEAMEWISEGMKPLGEEYVNVMRRGAIEERWVDVYPSQGKRAGAFSTGFPGTHPFIMMNHNDDIYGMSTLAHELGHSLHSYYAWRSQPMIYAHYGIFLAEVASNFNQALTRDYLLRTNEDPQFQIAVIEEAMSNFHRYFFIMPTLARFELAIHERVEKGQALTADYLIDLMADLFAEGYGEEIQFDHKREGITWAVFHTHLYYNFYVYQYTTGISAAHALAEKVLRGENGAADRYLGFLKAGGSAYPLDTLKAAGVDMTSPEPVETTFAVLSSYVDRLEQLVGAA
jgi:oligoendopeptidase F